MRQAQTRACGRSGTRHRRGGFVLLLTLMMVLIAGAALASLAHRSLGRAMDAQRSEQALQQRWAIHSAQRAVRPRLEHWLAMVEDEREMPVRQIVIDLPLEGARLVLLVSDEQAKLNINSLHSRRGTRIAAQTVQRLTAHAEARPEVQLRPATGIDAAAWPDSRGLMLSPAQVFDAAGPAKLMGHWLQPSDTPLSPQVLHPWRLSDAAVEPEGLLTDLTLWSDGQVNFHRASERVLAEATAGVLSSHEVAAILALRQQRPNLELGQLLELLELDEARAARARMLLTDRSRSFALWIIYRGPHRDRIRTVVRSGGEGGALQTWQMQW